QAEHIEVVPVRSRQFTRSCGSAGRAGRAARHPRRCLWNTEDRVFGSGRTYFRPIEWKLPREEFIQNDAERINIGVEADAALAYPLGSGVVWRHKTQTRPRVVRG